LPAIVLAVVFSCLAKSGSCAIGAGWIGKPTIRPHLLQHEANQQHHDAGAKPIGNAICNIPPSRPEACGIRRLITATKRCAAISGKMLTASRQSQQRVGDGAGERLLYDPTEAAINKSWKPGEIDERSGSRARSSINAELRHENRPRQYRPWPRHGRARPSAAGALDPRVFNPG